MESPQAFEGIKVIPLGGLGEVGLNLMVIQCDDEYLLVDCGVYLPDLYWLGLELVIPDFRFLETIKDKIVGLVVTHGHEDHVGAIPYLLDLMPLPVVFSSRFARRLIEDKMSELKPKYSTSFQDVVALKTVPVGRNFGVEFIHVTHSTVASFALAIRTPYGVVVHSGDFKFDETPYRGEPTDRVRLAEIGEEKPLLLLSDSTNSECSGRSESESSINSELEALIKDCKGAAIVAFFASNVHRIQQLVDIGKRLKRYVFLSGRSMERYVNLAASEGYLEFDPSLLFPIDQVDKYPRNRVLILSTGSQGEARSSLLRLAKNENKFLKIHPTDRVILSSRNIPGNERATNYVINSIYKLGAEVFYNQLRDIHASGHAYQQEQIEMIKLIRPKYFIPVHGEYRHLWHHASTAQKTGIPHDTSILVNGNVWTYSNGKAEVAGEVPYGRKWVYQGTVGAMDDERIKARRRSAGGGVVSIHLHVPRQAKVLKHLPTLRFDGFLLSPKRQSELSAIISSEIRSTFQEWKDRKSELDLQEVIIGVARRVTRRELGVKPLVIVHLCEEK